MSDADLSTLSTLGIDPIPGDEPAGIPPADEPMFEELSEEIRKLDSLSDDNPVKWPRVVDLATTILATKSKSLQTANYRAFGLLQMQGYAGLEEGLSVVRDLLKTFWDTLHPPVSRLRGRKQSLEWLADRAVTFLDGTPPTDTSRLDACVDVMQVLDTAARERFADNPPGITKLLSKLKELQKEASGAGHGNGTGPDGEPVLVVSAKQATAPGVITSRQQAYDQLKLVMEFLRKHDPHSPVSYLLERAYKWGQLPYEDLYKDLMSRQADARQTIWWVLGIDESK